MSLAAIVDAMEAAGCTAKQIAVAVRAYEEAAPARSKHADAQARYRAKKAAEKAGTQSPVITSDHGDHVGDEQKKGLPHTPSKENNPSFTIVQEGRYSAREIDELFEKLWQAYPRRAGSNPKKPARTKFEAALKRDTFENILAGVEAYAASRMSEDPRFTAQAVTWLGQDRWRDDHRPAARPPPADRTSALTRAFQNAAREFSAKPTDHDNVVEIIPPGQSASAHDRGDHQDGERFGARGSFVRNPR